MWSLHYHNIAFRCQLWSSKMCPAVLEILKHHCCVIINAKFIIICDRNTNIITSLCFNFMGLRHLGLLLCTCMCNYTHWNGSERYHMTPITPVWSRFSSFIFRLHTLLGFRILVCFPHPSRLALGPTQRFVWVPWVKLLRCGADLPPKSSAELKERV
jgi:hypothetical protein